MTADNMHPVRQVCPVNPYTEFYRSEIEQSIAARFEKQVIRHRHRLAVRTSRHQLTYDDLNKLANRLARSINRRTTREPAAVALLFEHDAPLIAAILAALKAGRFYVVLDPSHPSQRLRNILEDSEADMLIADAKHFGRAQEIAPQRCGLMNCDALGAGLADDNLALATPASALAYLIYTSGSTGKPKGVCQTQRNVLHHTRKYTNACHLCADDRFSLLALCSFSASVSNLFGALLNGAAILPFKVKEEGVASLLAWLQEEEISIYHSVPLLFRNLAKIIPDHSDFANLRLLKLGGEPITRSDFDLFKQHFPERSLLYIGLGATEMNCIRYWLLDRRSNFSGPIAPVGFAVEDTDVLLLDDNQKEVPPGEIGEIAIRSPYLFPGYWRRPELTNSVFIRDPRGSSERVFRTGDLGRMLPDGLLRHLGRNEHQIKIRGARVEAGEIEFALRNQAEVNDCVVIAKDGAEEKELVAFLTNKTGIKPETSTLRNRLAETLPEYMLPARFVWLDELPLTNGKVDRKALEELELPPLPLAGDYVAPQNELELQLVRIWQAVLRHERIGIRDNFVELGGDSLSAAQTELEIEKLLGCKVPVAALFRSPTIESLASYLVQGESAASLQYCALRPAKFHETNETHGSRGAHFLRQVCMEIWDRITIAAVRATDATFGPGLLPLILAPRIMVDALRRLRDYRQFLRLRARFPANFWRGRSPLRHYLRMIVHWRQSLAICLLADRLGEKRWQNRIQIHGTPPDALPEWGKRPVVIAYLHTDGFVLLRYWMQSRGMTAATLVRARPGIIRRFEKRKELRAGEMKMPDLFYRENMGAVVRFLTAGRALMVAIDAHPPSRTLMMGAPIGINDGAARLAILSNALLVPASVWIRSGSNLLFCFGPPAPQEIIERGDIVEANEYLTRELWKDLSDDRCAIGWTTLEAYSPKELIRPRLVWP